MKKNKNVILFHNLKTSKIKKKIEEISFFLSTKKLQVLVVENKAEKAFPPSLLVISLGGDGTYLNAVKYAGKTPILGVHMGSLGFLTPYSSSSALSAIERFLKKDKIKLKTNYFLKAVLEKKTKKNSILKNQIFKCVNDVVIERGSFNHLIKLSIFINKEFIYSLKSDGIIISSPLGSTAYNLAAGGPILDAQVSCLVVTPICSHSLTSRPLVIPSHSEIDLVLEDTKAYLTLDGLTQCEISANTKIKIVKDKKYFLSVVDKNHKDFYLLRQKLKFGQRD
ncbi:MAG: NAD(+)/NADH kinase [Bdellovibrionales bacterium]|nr:NAD(+)/NADH kinase [Bdellovibrionales bacterium]